MMPNKNSEVISQETQQSGSGCVIYCQISEYLQLVQMSIYDNKQMVDVIIAYKHNNASSMKKKQCYQCQLQIISLSNQFSNQYKK